MAIEQTKNITNIIIEGLAPGIVSGLLTSLITLVLVLNWNSIIRPFWEGLMWKGVRIDKNKWKVKAEGTADDAVINFHQSAYRISDDIQWTTNSGQPITYTIQGEFNDLILTATFKEKDKASLDRGTVTLKYLDLGNKKILKGGFAWYEKDEIVHGDYELTQDTPT